LPRLYFNDAWRWDEMHSNTSIFLLKVAVHELGHSFGLYHSTDINDVMYPSYQPNEEVNITPDTIAGIVKLYGAVTPVNPDIPCPDDISAQRLLDFFKNERKWRRPGYNIYIPTKALPRRVLHLK